MSAPRRAASPRRSGPARASAPPSARRDRDGAAARKLEEAPLPREREAVVPEAAGDGAAFDGQYRIKLEAFEGPLDLLLHLIQQHELDILDIPVSFITEKYLEYLKLMQVLSIEIASEYLVMAATLVHIKSKMLLPAPPPGQDDGMPQEEEEDPRAELVRRLLEYQKYKAAAADLAERGTLGRDVFSRGVEEEHAATGPAPFAKLEVFGLLEAFERILKKSKVKIDHEVVFDRISITDRIVELTERLEGRRAVRFEWLFLGGKQGPPTRFDLVITFLAMLEMCRMKLLRVYQTGPLAPIYMGLIEEGGDLSEEDRHLADEESAAALAPDPEPSITDEPAPEEPAAEEPSLAGGPATEGLATEEPAAEEPSLAGGPATEGLATEEPAMEEPAPGSGEVWAAPAAAADPGSLFEYEESVPLKEPLVPEPDRGATPGGAGQSVTSKGLAFEPGDAWQEDLDEASATDLSVPEAVWEVSPAGAAPEQETPPSAPQARIEEAIPPAGGALPEETSSDEPGAAIEEATLPEEKAPTEGETAVQETTLPEEKAPTEGETAVQETTLPEEKAPSEGETAVQETTLPEEKAPSEGQTGGHGAMQPEEKAPSEEESVRPEEGAPSGEVNDDG